jgi:hypothetical protein
MINFPFVYTDIGTSSSSAVDNDNAPEEQLEDQDQDLVLVACDLTSVLDGTKARSQ